MKSVIIAFFIFITISTQVVAKTTYGGEIISYQKFGEGLMVVSSKIVPLSGTVSNMFFFNREDLPWNGNIWYEYDWEIRGKSTLNGWSQIRTRNEDGGNLLDAPVDISVKSNLNSNFYHYILIRKKNQIVYDIRLKFDSKTYDHTNSKAHGGNSESLLVNGPRIYATGKDISSIPNYKELDFNLGITGFGNSWSGPLPEGPFSREFKIKFARFYQFTSSDSFKLQENPMWRDEFDGDSIDYSKWQVAEWYSGNTQFTHENINVSSGVLRMRINRD